MTIFDWMVAAVGLAIVFVIGYIATQRRWMMYAAGVAMLLLVAMFFALVLSVLAFQR